MLPGTVQAVSWTPHVFWLLLKMRQLAGMVDALDRLGVRVLERGEIGKWFCHQASSNLVAANLWLELLPHVWLERQTHPSKIRFA